jgi:multiple antibiotic resistance protein
MDQGPISGVPFALRYFGIQSLARGHQMLGPGEIFTLFFVTLGPLKVLGPFAQQTHGLAPAAVRGIAVRVFVLSLLAIALGGLLGRALALSWSISMPALLISTGVIFFLVALQLVLEQYEPPKEIAAAPLPADPMSAALKLTFPTVVTPYGIAALIAMLAATGEMFPHLLIWAVLAVVMVLNLIAMLFAHAVMHGAFVLGMRLLGAVLGVLQVALAVQIMIMALRKLGVLEAIQFQQ